MTKQIDEQLAKNECATRGKYTILEKLGSGQSASVYLAQTNDLAHLVALKIIKDDCWKETLKSEARTLRALNAVDEVVRLIDDKSENDNFIALEYLPVSLDTIIEQYTHQ